MTLLTEMPLTTGEVAPELESVLTVLPDKFTVAPPPIVMPTTVDEAPVEDKVLIVLPVIFVVVEGFEKDKPVTAPPVPDDVRLVMVFPDNVRVVAEPEVPMVIPVMAPWPVILVMVLLEMEEAVPPIKLDEMPVIAFVPPVRLLIVLLVMVLVGAPPSVLISPENVVAPVKVIFEKLLLLQVIVEPVAELAFVLRMVTVPPAPVLENPVTMEFPLMVSVPVAERLIPSLKNVTLPVVFITRLVKVLLL